MKDKANRVSGVPKRRGAGEGEEHWLESLELERDALVPGDPDDTEVDDDDLDDDDEDIEEDEDEEDYR